MPCNYQDYPQNWKTEIVPSVLKRAGEIKNEKGEIIQEAKCEECGVKNHSIIHRFGKGKNDWEYFPEGMESEAWLLDGKKATRIVLTTAHLNHDKDNHDINIEDLRSWCQKCHLNHDIEHHKANRKYGRNHKKNNYKLDL